MISPAERMTLVAYIQNHVLRNAVTLFYSFIERGIELELHICRFIRFDGIIRGEIGIWRNYENIKARVHVDERKHELHYSIVQLRP